MRTMKKPGSALMSIATSITTVVAGANFYGPTWLWPVLSPPKLLVITSLVTGLCHLTNTLHLQSIVLVSLHCRVPAQFLCMGASFRSSTTVGTGRNVCMRIWWSRCWVHRSTCTSTRHQQAESWIASARTCRWLRRCLATRLVACMWLPTWPYRLSYSPSLSCRGLLSCTHSSLEWSTCCIGSQLQQTRK
jgi:hypothetical protein